MISLFGCFYTVSLLCLYLLQWSSPLQWSDWTMLGICGNVPQLCNQLYYPPLPNSLECYLAWIYLHVFCCTFRGIEIHPFILKQEPCVILAFYQLGLKLLYVFVCVCLCVCVCVRPQLSHALNYVIPLLCHYSQERNGSYWKFAGLIGQGTSS